MKQLIKGFDPIVSNNSKVLILGSMPSVVSLDKQEYYGFAHNRFWKIMHTVFHDEITSYDKKKQLIINNHLALWDVIHACEREGSLDSAIRNVEVNNLSEFLKRYPNINAVICNGKKSYELYMRYFKNEKVKVYVLPSTSNANRTIKEDVLFSKWKLLLNELLSLS